MLEELAAGPEYCICWEVLPTPAERCQISRHISQVGQKVGFGAFGELAEGIAWYG